jgi:hypothetical protein
MIFASEEIIQQRLMICSGCDHKCVVGFFAVCNSCGCIIKAKAALENANCPEFKWPQIEIAPTAERS